MQFCADSLNRDLLQAQQGRMEPPAVTSGSLNSKFDHFPACYLGKRGLNHSEVNDNV